jgi:ribonuclease J
MSPRRRRTADNATPEESPQASSPPASSPQAPSAEEREETARAHAARSQAGRERAAARRQAEGERAQAPAPVTEALVPEPSEASSGAPGGEAGELPAPKSRRKRRGAAPAAPAPEAPAAVTPPPTPKVADTKAPATKVPATKAAPRKAKAGKAPAKTEVAVAPEVEIEAPAVQTKPGKKGAAAKADAAKAGTGKTRVIFLGGLGEIGRNMTVFEHDGKILIVDSGLMFPTEDMLGVDLVLPDYTYVRERKKQVVGLVLTHAHEDHIGGIPYLLRDINPPIYGTDLTLGLLKGKLDEHHLTESTRLKEIKAGGRLTVGPFQLRFLQVAHSIPGCVAIAITTAGGTILHTGDWKLDPTPVDGKPTDVAGLAEVGREGVDLLLSDSTNALVPGHLPSERTAGEAVREVVRQAAGRVVIACFASNIHRIQQIIRAAHDNGRMVAFIGRSMVRNVQIASDLGYLEIPEGVVVSVDEAGRHPGRKVVVVCTGSQGEPLSALSLMAVREHRHITLQEADTVVFSATPIPGNESAVRRVIDGLSRIGVEVVAPPTAAVHVSGHAASGEQRTMLSLVKPKWFIPVHGEYRMLKAHAKIGHETGIPMDHMMLLENGDIVELGKGKVKRAEKIEAGYVFVDGLGIGDVESVVIRDRQLLAGDGILVCVITVDRASGEILAGPDLISRGFVYEGQAGAFYDQARTHLRESLESVAREELAEWATLRRHVRRVLGKFVYNRTGRRPIILPVVMEV